ncbi:hypothetical protein QQP08_024098, partial [Theobroma cacao]
KHNTDFAIFILHNIGEESANIWRAFQSLPNEEMTRNLVYTIATSILHSVVLLLEK